MFFYVTDSFLGLSASRNLLSAYTFEGGLDHSLLIQFLLGVMTDDSCHWHTACVSITC